MLKGIFNLNFDLELSHKSKISEKGGLIYNSSLRHSVFSFFLEWNVIVLYVLNVLFR